jgi:raffinose/stachyose/melibiose transport system substrate-binding protein
MKKLLILLTILVFGISSLMAGGQSEEGMSEKEATTLSVMYTYNQASLGQDARVDAWYKMQEEMISAHPEVNFEFEYVPHDAYQDKIQILAAANELPDVFEVKGSWVKNFVSNNRLMPLNEIMAADKAWSGNYKDDVLTNFTIDGSVYAVSIEGGGTTHVIFYNKTILKEVGYDSFPTEYDDFKVMLQAIAAKGYTPISLGDKSSWVAESCYLSTIGNRMTGSDWTNSITNKEGATFTDPQFIKALDVLAELAEIGAFNADMNSLEYTQQRTPYYNGKAAMFVEGGWAINHVIENTLPEILAATGIADFPKVPGQMGADNLNTGGTSGWAIGASSSVADSPEKKELVVELMKRFSNMENAVKLAETGRTPAMKVTDFDSSALHALNIEYFSYMDKFVPAPTYDLVWDPAVIETLNSGIQMLLIGQVSSEELAESVQKEYTR